MKVVSTESIGWSCLTHAYMPQNRNELIRQNPSTNLSVLFAVLLSPIWSGCPTSAPGSSSVAPSPLPTASGRWSFQCCSKHGAKNCSSVINGSGLRRAQQVLDSTVPDQPTRFQGDLHWRCSSIARDNDIADPLASLQPEHL